MSNDALTNVYILVFAVILDALFGDPPRLPHIVAGIGKIITLCERALRRLFPSTPRGERLAGGILAVAVPALFVGVPVLVFAATGRIHPALRFALECFVCFQLLAMKGLADAAYRVRDALARNDLPAARTAVGRIVGRDTAALDAAGVTRAAVETVAENASDGVIAPMFYFALGGAPLMLAYKAINTMDSMIGYKNEKYLHFGRAAARLDDIANFVPARLTAYMMLLQTALCSLSRRAAQHNCSGMQPGFRNALRIYRRDRRAHSSPNSGHPESVCAGALGIQLGGDSMYGGRWVRKPVIGDATRAVEPDDISRANVLMMNSACVFWMLCLFSFAVRETWS